MNGFLIAALLAAGPAPTAPPRADGPTPPRLRSGSITNTDYPADAIRAGAQGSTRILLDVAPYGGVTNCRITQSSGSELLDITTCAIARQRFKFEPGRDARGERVASTFSQSVRWTLPEDEGAGASDFTALLPVFAAGEMRLALVQDSLGGRCAIETRGEGFTGAEALICPPQVRVEVDELMGVANAMLTVTTLTPAGETPVPRRPVRGSLVARVVSDLEVRADGHVANCRDVATTGPRAAGAPSFCQATNMPFPAFRPDAQGRIRSGRIEIEVYRLGAPET